MEELVPGQNDDQNVARRQRRDVSIEGDDEQSGDDGQLAEESESAQFLFQQFHEQRYLNPFPPAQVLAGYKNLDESLVPELLKRLKAEADNRHRREDEESSHRRAIESATQAMIAKDVASSRFNELYVPTAAFCAVAIVCGVGMALVIMVQNLSAQIVTGVLSTSSLIGLVAAFLKYRIRPPVVLPASFQNDDIEIQVLPTSPDASAASPKPQPTKPAPSAKP
jgi:hypothetical protein